MEINCSYCENCDTLWDNKDLNADGLCFDCQLPTIAMVARPTKAAQQGVQADVCQSSHIGKHTFIIDEIGEICIMCGTRQ